MTLAGCASTIATRQNIALDYADSIKKIKVKYASIEVANLAVEDSEIDYSFLGNIKLIDTKFTPPLSEVLKRRIENTLVTTGNSGVIQIWILDATVSRRSRGSELIPLVGVYSSFYALKPYSCSATFVIKSSNKSKRINMNHYAGELDPADIPNWQKAMSNCQAELVIKVSDAIKTLQ
jgi:hypothetical protein